MASSLLFLIFELSTSCFFDKLSRGFGGGLVCGTRYSGSIHFLEFSIIDSSILGPIQLLMMICLNAKVPCLNPKGAELSFLLQLFPDLS